MIIFSILIADQIKSKMNIEDMQNICKELPSVTEDIKWGNDLVFSIGGKMFCVIGLNQSPVSASFKVTDDEFDEMSSRNGFRPAPYVARYKWVLADDIRLMNRNDWKKYLQQSYNLVKDKLPLKTRKELKLV
jgi:predicted DNA-binding protein (MmcQ/YjbR family)